MDTLATSDAAYLAGLIDADGTVTLTRRHRNENRHLAISISNTDRSLLAYVRDTIGAGKITRKCTQRKTHTPSFVFGIRHRQALRLVEQIHKARHAELILRKYIALKPRNGKYSANALLTRREFEEKVLGIRPGHGHRSKTRAIKCQSWLCRSLQSRTAQ